MSGSAGHFAVPLVSQPSELEYVRRCLNVGRIETGTIEKPRKRTTVRYRSFEPPRTLLGLGGNLPFELDSLVAQLLTESNEARLIGHGKSNGETERTRRPFPESGGFLREGGRLFHEVPSTNAPPGDAVAR